MTSWERDSRWKEGEEGEGEVVVSAVSLSLVCWKREGKMVVGRTYRFIPFKENHSTTFVSCCQVVSRVVEFDGGDDVGWREREGGEEGGRGRVTSGD